MKGSWPFAALAATLLAGCASVVEYADTTWSPAIGNLAGLPSECGNMAFLSVRPDRDQLIAGIALKGLFKQSSATTAWSPLGTGSGSAVIVNRASSIVYDPSHPATFWESGIYNQGGVYRTDDDGVTFRELGDPGFVRHFDLLSIDFGDPDRKTLVAGGHESGQRILRSLDGGVSWVDLGPNFPPDAGNTSWPLVLDPQTYLVATSAGTTGTAAGIYRTTDAGAHWTRVFSGPLHARPVRRADGTIFWLRDNDAGLVKSVDQGQSWTTVVDRGVLTTADPGVIEMPDGSLAALSGGFMSISRDDGATWRHVGSPVPYVPIGLAYSKYRKNFYIWHFDCAGVTPDPVPADGIMGTPYDWQAP